jgi:hypothetical protein
MVDEVVWPARLAGPVQRMLYGRLARRVFQSGMALTGQWHLRRFERNTARAAPVNDAALLEILRRHRRTEFGRLHGFAAILRAADPAREYRRRVPLASYRDFEPWLERMAAGEHRLLTADPVVFFAPSSGTTGKPKMIPMTRRSLKGSLLALLLSRAVLNQALPAGHGGLGVSLVRMSGNPERTPGGIPTGDASAYGMRQAAWLLPWLYTTPVAALTIADKPSAMFLHVLFALYARDLDHISATFAHYVLQFFRTLEQRQPALIDALASGRLPADLAVSPELRTRLEAVLQPDPALAARIGGELQKGMQGIAQRIWPRFSCVAAVTTGSFDIYVPRLRQYIGDAMLCNLLYGATEAPIGISVDTHQAGEYSLIPGACAVEFIPENQMDLPAPEAIGVAELRAGEAYELVITNDAGFYRYRMDDVVRVKGFHGTSPRLEFAYRRGTLLNLAAEKTTDEQVAEAVSRLHRDHLVHCGGLADYTVAADVDVTPPRYRFFLELSEPGKALDSASIDRFASCLDETLRSANVDYRILRENRGLDGPRVDLVRAGTFDALLALTRNARAAAADNTVKVTRLARNPEQIALLEAHCIHTGNGPLHNPR